ncbi:ArsR/SmtB family transcription factor [Methanolobus profundi]|nr:winged helix-turn-helix domain-containing protein [Methanolobus profundi]
MAHEDFKILNALGNETRLKMFKYINEQDMHISKVARVLEISISVASKHATILEDANLIQRKIFGKTHVLSIKNKKICKIDYDPEIIISSDYHKIFDAVESLKKVTSIDGK